MDVTLGEKIMIYRVRAGLSKKALAEKAGISIATLTKYESSTGAFNDIILTRIAIALNLTSNMLQFGFDDPIKYTPRRSLLPSN